VIDIEWGNVAQIFGPWITSGVAIAIAIWGHNNERDQTALREIKADMGRLFERQDKTDQRLAAVEREIEHLPTSNEVHALALKVNEIGATINVRFESLAEKIDLVIAQNERAQDRLADKEGGR
jgi:hypothetical protein